MVKSKVHGDTFVEALTRILLGCSKQLGEASARTDRHARERHAHVRELGVYQRAATGLREVMPGLYGVHQDPERDAHVLVMEYLGDQVVLMNSVERAGDWSRRHVDAALVGIAGAHAAWLGRERELLKQPWSGVAFDARAMARRSDYWLASAEYVARIFPRLLGPGWLRRATRLTEAIPDWWAELEQMPRTLTHGDFTPRNVALRKDGLRLVAYDWEYATLHVPQRDVVEFLAHVLAPDVDARTVDHHVGVHRRALERAAGVAVPSGSWHRGYQLALADYVLTKFTTTLVLHSVVEHPFVERLAATTMRLVEIERRRAAGAHGWGTHVHDREAA